jgi:hypothetical protein
VDQVQQVAAALLEVLLIELPPVGVHLAKALSAGTCGESRQLQGRGPMWGPVLSGGLIPASGNIWSKAGLGSGIGAGVRCRLGSRLFRVKSRKPLHTCSNMHSVKWQGHRRYFQMCGLATLREAHEGSGHAHMC